MDQAAQPPAHIGNRSRVRIMAVVITGLLCFAAGLLTREILAGRSSHDGSAKASPEQAERQIRTLEGRLENLTTAVFDLRATIEKGYGGTPDSARPSSAISIVPPAAPVPVSKLLGQAEKLRTDGKLQEAEIILTRALQTDPDDIGAWRALAAVQRERSTIMLKEGSLLSAAQSADRARASVNGIKGLSVNPTHNVDPNVVTEEEGITSKAGVAVRDAIDSACKGYISSALNSKDEGTHWYRTNERKLTVEGLKQLRKVIELGPWASDQTRMSANEAFSALKRMVSPEEWNELLAHAGFDPGSRETLKKLGLD